MSKKISLAIFWCISIYVFFLCGEPLTAETKIEVALRFSEHEGFLRIVFEAGDEAFIRNTNAIPSEKQLKVQFPSDFNLKPQGKFPLETVQQGKTLLINISRPFKIKVLRLISPPRFSIDILKEDKDQISRVTDKSDIDFPPAFRIVIDPGHGGYNIGILTGDFKEKDVTLSVARQVENFLVKKNRAVHLTRKADQFLSITDRALSANQKIPDVFVSIHLSMSDNFVIYTPFVETISGELTATELYGLTGRQRRYTEKSRALSESMGRAIKDEFKGDIVYREMALPLLNSVGSASILVEIPRTLTFDQDTKTRLSNALLKGLAFYANR